MPSTHHLTRTVLRGLCFLCLFWSGRVSLAADPFETWTVRASGVSNILQNVVYGNGLFVAVGYEGAIATSPDGIEWSAQTADNANTLQTITFGDGMFVTTGNRGTILFSTDGTNWTGASSGTSNPLFGAAYGNGMFVVVGGSNVIVSDNGIHWTARVNPLFGQAFLNDVAFGHGQFVAVGAGVYTVSSTDTFSWKVGGPVPGNLFAIAYGDGVFAAVGGGFGDPGRIVSSTDGLSWSNYPSGTTATLVDIAYGNGRFLAIGLYLFFQPPASSEFFFTSRDGASWSNFTLVPPAGLFGLTYSNSRFVSVGANGVAMHTDSFAPAELQVRGVPGTNGLELVITGEIGRSYRVQAATELPATNWVDLFSFNNPQDTTTLFLDSRASRLPQRFYRVVSP